MLKLAAEDLKAFYFEAVAGQPHPMTGQAAADWFWGETSAATLFVALRERCIADTDPARQYIGRNWCRASNGAASALPSAGGEHQAVDRRSPR